MSAFNPEDFGFIRIDGFHFAGSETVDVYEFKNNAVVDGAPAFLRLNLYLSKDGRYVTIWSGLLEPLITEGRLEHVLKPLEPDLRGLYEEVLFRGYIDSRKAAEHIFKALRIDRTAGRYLAPQMLTTGPNNGDLRCEVVNPKSS